MGTSRNDIPDAVTKLENILVAKFPGVRAVLATARTSCMIIPEEDSAYIHIYLLNVGAEEMVAVEDAAYDAWDEVRPSEDCPASYFLYTPDETYATFSAYASSKHELASCLTIRNLASQKWQANSLQAAPRSEGWNLVEMLQQMGRTARGSYPAMQLQQDYRRPAAADVETADTELPMAA